MHGSLCSHLGTTRLPKSFDHDSLATIGSKTVGDDSRMSSIGAWPVSTSPKFGGGSIRSADVTAGAVG